MSRLACLLQSKKINLLKFPKSPKREGVGVCVGGAWWVGPPVTRGCCAGRPARRALYLRSALCSLPRHAVRARQHDLSGDERAAALVQVQRLGLPVDPLLLQDGHHPGELAELRLAVLAARDPEAHAVRVPLAAELRARRRRRVRPVDLRLGGPGGLRLRLRPWPVRDGRGRVLRGGLGGPGVRGRAGGGPRRGRLVVAQLAARVQVVLASALLLPDVDDAHAVLDDVVVLVALVVCHAHAVVRRGDGAAAQPVVAGLGHLHVVGVGGECVVLLPALQITTGTTFVSGNTGDCFY
ncbi:hypothetical protein FOCC_FOCC015722 [Frankliniella occidentalis]|nr:hypothetical protein FOCC_FOCC015722 [Frankliniella occidentalis]